MITELKKVNAHRFVPRNELDRATLDLAVTRAELAFINRDLTAGTFGLGCALARVGQRARDIRADVREAKRQSGAAVHDTRRSTERALVSEPRSLARRQVILH